MSNFSDESQSEAETPIKGRQPDPSFGDDDDVPVTRQPDPSFGDDDDVPAAMNTFSPRNHTEADSADDRESRKRAASDSGKYNSL